MDRHVQHLLAEAEALADQCRLIPAVQHMEQAQQLTTNPALRAVVTYNIGTVCWSRLGDGIAARAAFLDAVTACDDLSYGEDARLKVVHANAIENSMLCALSYDEFFDLADRLDRLVADVPILQGLRPRVESARDRGDAWWSTLMSIAYPYYDRNDPKLDAGRYGEARATFHLMLQNRLPLRLKREYWRVVLHEFSALSMRMSVDCVKARGGDMDPHPPNEHLSIVTDVVPFLDEYLRTNSGDQTIATVRGHVSQLIDNARDRYSHIVLTRRRMHERQAPAAVEDMLGLAGMHDPTRSDMSRLPHDHPLSQNGVVGCLAIVAMVFLAWLVWYAVS